MRNLCFMKKKCLLQLIGNVNDLSCLGDTLVFLLYECRYEFRPKELRLLLEFCIHRGFNPFSSDLFSTSKIMVKSIVAICDTYNGK